MFAKGRFSVPLKIPYHAGTHPILVTGATGFLGSHLMAELLCRGYHVSVLVRPGVQATGRERIRALLNWFGLSGDLLSGDDIVEGYLDRPNLGLNQSDTNRLMKCESIVHCASATAFAARKKAAVERANITGLQNILTLALQGKCSSFHYVSTVYAMGKGGGICREEPICSDSFNNFYEESKCRAEHLALEACTRSGTKLFIVRPSIVYGHSRTGRTFRFNALYYPIKTVSHLRDLFEFDIRNRGGAHAHAMGVSIGSDGRLRLPIRIETVEGGGLNLIPVDYFISSYLALMESGAEGGIFHLVNSRPTPIGDLIAYVQAYFRLDGLEWHDPPDSGAVPRSALENLMDSYLDVYRPYMRDTRVFENERTRALLLDKGIECPAFDYEIFSRCMAYAVESDWGRKLQVG